MRLLALDTSTRSTSVAVWDSTRPQTGEERELPREAREDPAPGERPGHATRLMPLIVELLEREGWSWSELERIVVGRGPGTFTGLRIGLATARALASGLRLPLIGVCTLESLAAGVGSGRRAPDSAGDVPLQPDSMVAVLDARRREVFAAAWRPGAGGLGDLLMAPRALSPQSLVEAIASVGERPLAFGDGAVEYRSTLERSGVAIPPDRSQCHFVSAVEHCLLASRMQAQAPSEVQPEYLRLPDAELARLRADHELA